MIHDYLMYRDDPEFTRQFLPGIKSVLGWFEDREMLAPWERMTAKGMTSFGERDINPRSECHGWSASPCFDLLHTVAGITPGSPGFETVIIQPNPGKLQEMEVEFPHPKGTIHLSLQRKGEHGIIGEIILPPKLKGTFLWKDISMDLNKGENKIDLK